MTTQTFNQVRTWQSNLSELLPGVALALIMCWAVVQSLAVASWAPGLGVLVPVAFVAIVIGVLFAQARSLPGWLAHPLSIAIAITWTVQLLGPQMDARLESWRDRFVDLVIRVIGLMRVVGSGGRGEDILLFVLALSVLCWMLCYGSMWMLFRRGWIWTPILLNAAVILVNYAYVLPKPTTLFFIFLGAALLLLVYQNTVLRQQSWLAQRIDFPDFLPLRFVLAAALTGTFVVLLTNLLPGSVSANQASETWRTLRQPFREARERWEDVFSTINAPPGAGGGAFTASAVSLGGARALSNDIVMYVRSLEFDYLRAVAFDKYTGSGWQNTTGEQARAALGLESAAAARSELPAGVALNLNDIAGTTLVTQTITLASDRKDDLVIVGGKMQQISLPTLIEHNYIAGPAGATPNYDDTALIAAVTPLREGLTFSVTTRISQADIAGLRQAGTDYPAWVRERYLQLPSTITPRTVERAQALVAEVNARTPYDQAAAIQTYLRTLPYNENIDQPPVGVDLVDHFLFEMREGYCDYYASSMVVMLRSLGVPARLVQGYAGGTFDADRAAYEVRESIAHTWPEVYFPGYGWERFEPTPADYTSLPARPLSGAFGADPGDDVLGPGIDDDLDPGRFEEIDEALDQFSPAEPPQPEGAAPRGPDLRGPLAILGWMGTALLGFVGLAYVRYRMELRGLSGVVADYASTGLLARWAGLHQEPHLTPDEYAAQLGKALPQYRRTLQHLARAYSAQRYAGKDMQSANPDEVKELRWTLLQRIAARLVGRA
jgi:transglutaminase-like putative cysteine protease